MVMLVWIPKNKVSGSSATDRHGGRSMQVLVIDSTCIHVCIYMTCSFCFFHDKMTNVQYVALVKVSTKQAAPLYPHICKFINKFRVLLSFIYPAPVT